MIFHRCPEGFEPVEKVRRVRTPEGAQMFDLPIGAPIPPGGKPDTDDELRRLRGRSYRPGDKKPDAYRIVPAPKHASMMTFDCVRCGREEVRPVFLDDGGGRAPYGTGCAARVLGWLDRGGNPKADKVRDEARAVEQRARAEEADRAERQAANAQALAALNADPSSGDPALMLRRREALQAIGGPRPGFLPAFRQALEEGAQDGSVRVYQRVAELLGVEKAAGQVAFVKHGSPGRPGYRLLHPRRRPDRDEVSATVARRLRQAGVPDLFNQPPDAPRPPAPYRPPPTRAPIPPPPFRPFRPSHRDVARATSKAMQAFRRQHSRPPGADEITALAAHARESLSKPFAKPLEQAIRKAWNDVAGAYPDVVENLHAIMPAPRMGRGVLGRTATSWELAAPPQHVIEIRKTMPGRGQLEDAPHRGGSTPGWDPARAAEAVTTHELGHVLWYQSMHKHGVQGREPSLRMNRQRPPDGVPSPTSYGTEDAAEHFAEVFTVTRMFRDPKYRHLTSGIVPPATGFDAGADRFVTAEHERRLAVWDAYVADVVAGRFPKPGSPPPPRLLSPETTGSPGFRWRTPDGLPPPEYRKAADMTTGTYVHDDPFFGHLTDEELEALGMGDWDDDPDDDPGEVVFVRGPVGFEKAYRSATRRLRGLGRWDESKHPRRPDGKFGRGPGGTRGPRTRAQGKKIPTAPAPARWPRMGLQEVPGHLLHAGNNDRKTFDPAELRELAASIAKDGIAFPPLVRPHPTKPGELEIVGGERRVRAMRDVLGWENIPVKVQDLDDEQASMLMFAENVNRVDLKPVEEAKGYQERMDRFGLTAEDIAARANRPLRRVKERLDLLRLEPQIQDLVDAGQFPLGHARLMRDLDPNRQRLAMQTYNAGGAKGLMTQAQFSQLVARLQNEQDQDSMFDADSFFQVEDLRAEAQAEAARKKPKHRGLPLGASEIAQRFGVKPATVQQWKHRGHLPPPDHVVSGTPVWFETTIAGWKPPTRTRKAFAWLRGQYVEVDDYAA